MPFGASRKVHPVIVLGRSSESYLAERSLSLKEAVGLGRPVRWVSLPLARRARLCETAMCPDI